MSGSRESLGWALVLECVPAALFGMAVAFSVAMLAAQPIESVVPVASGAAAAIAAWALLHWFARRAEPFPMRHFDEACFEPEEPPVEAAEEPEPSDSSVTEPDELLLEDVLVEVDPAARVVRLFAQENVPTAGELHARIERHLGRAPRPALPDATQELHEALAALRRSLR